MPGRRIVATKEYLVKYPGPYPRWGAFYEAIIEVKIYGKTSIKNRGITGRLI
jgi:hypothetical protein